MASHPSIDPEVRITEWEEANKTISPCILLVLEKTRFVGLLVANIESIQIDL